MSYYLGHRVYEICSNTSYLGTVKKQPEVVVFLLAYSFVVSFCVGW